MMATVPHVTSGLGLRKFQADGFLLTRVYRRLGLVLGPVWTDTEDLATPEFDPWAVQPVASRYTD